MHQVIKVNSDLWKNATMDETRWIHALLVKVGLLRRDSAIVPTPEVPLREIAEIDLRARSLEARHASSSCSGECRKAYNEAIAKCNSMAFADQRKRYRNAALQAYELCLRNCSK
jgi:hypothetical protein